MKFELAQAVKEKIEILSRFRSKSTVVSSTIKNVDVFAMTQDDGDGICKFLEGRSGVSNTSIYNRIKEQGWMKRTESLLGFAVNEIRQRLIK